MTGEPARLCRARNRGRRFLSKLFDEYEAATKDETKKFSPSQRRVWRNSRMRIVREPVDIVIDSR
jgi:hypothetical protein